jgi:hypothetical protein
MPVVSLARNTELPPWALIGGSLLLRIPYRLRHMIFWFAYTFKVLASAGLSMRIICLHPLIIS